MMGEGKSMVETTIERSGCTIIFNGGSPLQGCPKTFEEHIEWVEKANTGKDEDCIHQPMWGTDCGFKTDYDGPLVYVSSRFYPPKSHYGPKWDGAISIMLFDDEIIRQEIEADSFEDLVKKTESFVQSFIGKLKLSLSDLVKEHYTDNQISIE